jgi:hypothetical protein
MVIKFNLILNELKIKNYMTDTIINFEKYLMDYHYLNSKISVIKYSKTFQFYSSGRLKSFHLVTQNQFLLDFDYFNFLYYCSLNYFIETMGYLLLITG